MDTYVLSSILIPSRDGELGPETLRGAPSRYHEPNEVLAIAIDFAECLSLGRPSRSIVIYYLGNGGGRRALSLGHRRRCINLMLCARHPFWRRATRARVVRRGYRCRNNQWTTDGRPYPSTQNNALLENKGNKQAKSGPQMARRHGRRPATLSGMPKHDSAIK